MGYAQAETHRPERTLCSQRKLLEVRRDLRLTAQLKQQTAVAFMQSSQIHSICSVNRLQCVRCSPTLACTYLGTGSQTCPVIGCSHALEHPIYP